MKSRTLFAVFCLSLTLPEVAYSKGYEMFPLSMSIDSKEMVQRVFADIYFECVHYRTNNSATMPYAEDMFTTYDFDKWKYEEKKLLAFLLLTSLEPTPSQIHGMKGMLGKDAVRISKELGKVDAGELGRVFGSFVDAAFAKERTARYYKAAQALTLK